jgi:hypothetical protein
MGDEGLEWFSHYSIRHDVLSPMPELAGAITVANATLSETVALLIESWSRMTPDAILRTTENEDNCLKIDETFVRFNASKCLIGWI